MDIIETDLVNEASKNVDVNGIVHFENQLVIFVKSIETSVSLHLEFWRELLEDAPDIEKLQVVGGRLSKSIEHAKHFFKMLCFIRQSNIRALLIFGNFLKEVRTLPPPSTFSVHLHHVMQVVNDEAEAVEYLDKAVYVSKSEVMNKQQTEEGGSEAEKYSENSNTGILTMSANIGSLFYVQNTNKGMQTTFT